MADQKISQLSSGGAAQATDDYVIARSGANYKVSGANVAAAATSVGTLSSLTVSGDLTVDTSTLKVDSANNRVGIGTASPDSLLHIAGDATALRIVRGSAIGFLYNTATASTDAFRMQSNGGPVELYTPAGQPIIFSAATSEKMRLDASGNLGLGVTPDAGAKMTVAGGILATAAFSATTGSTAGFDYSGGSMRFFSMGTSGSTKGAYSWIAKGADNSSSTPMTLDASGNLTVNRFNATQDQPVISFTDSQDNTGSLGIRSAVEGGEQQAYLAADTGLSFGRFISGTYTERARITSGGDFLINRTSSNGKLTVWGDGTSSAANAIGIFNSGGANVLVGRNDGLINTGATTESPYNHIVGGTNRDLYVDNGGDLGYVSSVRASKTNIAPVTDVNWLLALNPVTFNFRKRDEDGQYTDEVDGPLNHGLIAEEVEAVNADLCFYDNEEMGGALRGVNYSHLITPMLKLIQTQQSRIEALEARLEALEA